MDGFARSAITAESQGDRQHNFQRMMVYCHDSVGLGHLRRSLAICEHLSGKFPTASFLLATGTPYVPLFKLPDGVDFVKLPSIAKGADGNYESKTLGLKIDHLLAWHRWRTAASSGCRPLPSRNASVTGILRFCSRLCDWKFRCSEGASRPWRR